MKTNDIVLLFKGVSFRTDDIQQYIISLLQKFEVALLWDSDNLLIPSLLPTELDLIKNPTLMRQVLVCHFGVLSTEKPILKQRFGGFCPTAVNQCAVWHQLWHVPL